MRYERHEEDDEKRRKERRKKRQKRRYEDDETEENDEKIKSFRQFREEKLRKKGMNLNMTTLIIALIAGIIGFGSIHYLGKDNAVEEVAEEVIEIETGKKIDLSQGLK